MKCEHKNCEEEEAIECILIDNLGNEHTEYLCSEHAYESGFCCLCGHFFAGFEWFDFPEAHGNIRGYCDECSDMIRDECGENDREEDEYYEW